MSNLNKPPAGLRLVDPRTGVLTAEGAAWFAAVQTIPTWATTERPANPYVGLTGFNTTLGALESWNGAAWV